MVSNLEELNNKTVLITGVTGSIGFDLAMRLLKKNIKVIGVSSGLKNKSKTNLLLKYKNFKAAFINQDELQTIEKKCQNIKKKFGCPDIIINSAGIFKFKKLNNYSIKEIISTFNINIVSPIIITKFFIRFMNKKKSGTIINICSSSSYSGGGTFGHTIYTSTKHALLGFSRALDEEFRENNIRIGTVSPAGVKSNMTKNRKDINKDSLISLKQVTDSIIYLMTETGNGIVYEMRLWRKNR